MEKTIKEMSDGEVVNFLSTNPGHSHEISAQAEMTKRLIEKLDQSIKSSEKYSRRNLILSLALFFIGYMQLILIITTSTLSVIVRTVLILIVIISIILLSNVLSKN